MIFYLEYKNSYWEESLQELTTPEMKDSDAVFPGENWFYYWRTSPSLWENKLENYTGPLPLFVPINWPLHSEHQDQIDFGQIKPETDLKRLENIAKKLGKEIIFIIPVGPAPFLVNGGLPSYLARSLSINNDGIAISVLDDADRVNRVYSYYDPRVFQAFRKFMYHLGQYFTQSGVSSPLYALESFRIEEECLISFFKDHSQVFDGGFNRYIKQLQDTEPLKIEKLIENPVYEKDLKLEYSQLIQGLYLSSISEFLPGSFSGELKICLLGSGSIDLFKRSSDFWENQSDYFKSLMKSIVNGICPTSILINPKKKEGVFSKAISNLTSNSILKTYLSEDDYTDDSSLSFKPLFFFELHDGGEGHFSFEKAMEISGLKYFFEKEYPWAYRITNRLNLNIDEIEEKVVHFYFGSRLNQEQFNHVLKMFMNGNKVFLDINKISSKFLNKLEVFFTENNIAVEKINYISQVTKASLGEGLIVTYDSEKLGHTSLTKRSGFWDSMVSYLEVKQLKVQAEDGVEYFWKVRSSNSYELNYEEVRRVSFFNPTSYKRKVHIVSSHNFAFSKTIDQHRVEVNSTPIGIDILLLPGGMVTLDFGYFEG